MLPAVSPNTLGKSRSVKVMSEGQSGGILGWDCKCNAE